MFWSTEIEAIDPKTGKLTKWSGPIVPGISWQDAEGFCQRNGMGYCKVSGRIISIIPCVPGTLEPDLEKKIDFENFNNN